LNLIGQGSPLLVALLAIPLLIKGLGTDRFGILTLVWVVIGFSNVFDLGIGRALTQMAAEKLGADQKEIIPELFWTALFLMFFMGLIGAVIATLLFPWLVQAILKIPLDLQAESISAFHLLAISLPIVISSTGLRGLLEAHQRFDLTSAVNIGLGVYTFLSPLVVLPFSHSLYPVVGILLAGRIMAWGVFLLVALRVIPDLRQRVRIRVALMAPLIRFGGWMTICNTLGPLMLLLDRFLIGAFISVTAVAFYATPYELVTRLWNIPGPIAGVLFPAFAASFYLNPARAASLFERGSKYTFLAVFPFCLLIVTLAHEGFNLWLGADFSQHSARVAQLMALAVFLDCPAFIASVLLQGAGRPDLVAKLQLIELPVYLSLLWFLLSSYGIVGAALAWSVRLMAHAVLQFYLAQRLLPAIKAATRRLAFILGGSLLTMVCAALLPGLAARVSFLLVSLLAFTWGSWCFILDHQERAMVQGHFKSILAFMQ
jgi:O-antigen/teichoic acid export membrane protein